MVSFNRDTEGITVVKALHKQVEGQIILITGASAKGLGAGTAISLAHGKPAHLLLLARSASRVKPVMDEIASIDNSIKCTFVLIELDDFDSVRSAAITISAAVSKIDIFINNAGIMAIKDFTTNNTGVESQFATNHVGHFLLTNLLMDKILAAGKGARIVNLTSDGYTIGAFRFEDYNFSNGKEYDPVISDTNLSKNLDRSTFADINPIAIKNTGKPFVVGQPKKTQQGVSTTLVAALDPRIAADSGSYMSDCKVENARDYATSTENAKKLWSISEELVGRKFDL